MHLEQLPLEEQVVLLDNEMEMGPTSDEMEEWDALNERQQDLAECYAESVMEYGQFDQGTGANGAHYIPAEQNVFKSNGVKCSNCIFFNEDANDCIIVSGSIDPDAVCKLWIIPEDEFEETAAQEAAEEEPVAKSLWSGAFDPRNISK